MSVAGFKSYLVFRFGVSSCAVSLPTSTTWPPRPGRRSSTCSSRWATIANHSYNISGSKSFSKPVNTQSCRDWNDWNTVDMTQPESVLTDPMGNQLQKYHAKHPQRVQHTLNWESLAEMQVSPCWNQRGKWNRLRIRLRPRRRTSTWKGFTPSMLELPIPGLIPK